MKKNMILLWMPEYLGSHSAAWRQETSPRDQEMDFNVLRRQLQIAERGKLHGAFFTDTLAVGYYTTDVSTEALSVTAKASRWEPVTLLSALAACTNDIGLLGTIKTTYAEPYNVARMLASLDHISGGRAGWHVDTSTQSRADLNFDNRKDAPEERGTEFFEVVAGLWDSWEDNAFVRDKATGRYFDPTKLHALDHRGQYFCVAGPLNIARPPQGHPVIVQTGSALNSFAAQHVDLVCPWHASMLDAKSYYHEIRSRVAAEGRHPDHVKILPAVILSVGRSCAEAQEKLDSLDELINPILGLELLEGALQMDLSGYPLDGPVPEAGAGTDLMPVAQYYLGLAKRDRLTIRQLMRIVARVSVTPGGPTEIADMMQQWFEGGAADGFSITFADDEDSLGTFVEEVVPELQRRGLFQTDYQGTTLRDRLGLSKPVNRFSRGTQA